MNLAEMHCIPIKSGCKPFTKKQTAEYAAKIPTWQLDEDNSMLSKRFSFTDFTETMTFVNHVAELAQKEDHHPDMHVFYNHVDIDLWTHSVGGLHENDFILAAKIDQIIA